MGLDPGSLAMLAQGVSAVGGASNAFMQANASRMQGRYEQTVANDNAAMAELQAKSVESAGDRQAAERMRAARDLIARQRVAAAGQGVELDSGTGTLLQEDAAAIGALDAEAIRNNAWREAWGLRQEARQSRAAGKNARSRSRMEVAQTAATGGIRFATDLMQGAYLKDYLKKNTQAPRSDYDHREPGRTR